MKKSFRFAALILAAILAAETVSSGAVAFDDLDAKTAVAGASYALESFLYSDQDAQNKLYAFFNKEEVQTEEEDPEALVLYEESRNAKVVIGSVLNVRKEPNVESDIIGGAVLGQELEVIGERTVNGVLWYYLQLSDYHGYVAGDFIAVGDAIPVEEPETEPETQPEDTDEPTEPAVQQPADDVSVLPERFELGYDANQAGSDVLEKLTYYMNEINYCLISELPNRMEAGEATNAYSVLVYILEEYQKIAEIAAEYSMHDTFLRAKRDIAKIEYAREQLSVQTGMSEDDFYEEIARNNAEARAAEEEAARREAEAAEAARQAEEAARAAQAAADAEAQAAAAAAAEEAARQAEEAARQAEEARRQAEAAAQQSWDEKLAAAREQGAGTLGREIADTAAAYVGWLPYVWGGASLVSGADCSGFVGQILASKGLLDQGRANTHGYDSGSLRSVGYGVSYESLQPGDIVCYSGHVAIYFGNGIVVHEPAPGRFCEYGSVNMASIICIRRMY